MGLFSQQKDTPLPKGLTEAEKEHLSKYSFSRSGGRKWLGTTDGDMSRGEYEATTATENV